MYNFDKVIDRSGSDDLKHGALLPRWDEMTCCHSG